MNIIWTPKEIENHSMEIVEKYIAERNYTSLEKAVVKRAIHSTADPSLADNLHFSPSGLEIGHKALIEGASIYTDVNMLKAGISKKMLEKYGGEVYCIIDEVEASHKAAEWGITRAAASMYLLGDKLEDAVVAIGNSPTALFALLDMVERGIAVPSFVVGIPVGFVGAAESKELLMGKESLPHATLKGNRGGSPVAAAVINALYNF